MGRWTIAMVVLGLSAAAAHSGIYMPGEEEPPFYFVIQDGKAQPLQFVTFQVIMQDYMQIAMTRIPIPGTNPPQFKDSEKHLEYQKIKKSVESKRNRITVEDTIRLSAALLRLHDPGASSVLQSARGRDRENFVLLAHLAMSFHQQGATLDALRYQDAALSLRRPEIPGVGPAQTAWYLKVEKAFHTLLKARVREQRQLGPRGSVETLDPLFPVTFVGESGQYEAGTLAAAEKAKLPDDALAVVQQLLFWMPEDARLYWLLAELYNAQGDVKAAATIFDQCVDSRRFHTEQLRAHRLIVKDAVAKLQPPPVQTEKTWRDHPEILWGAGAILALILLPLVYWQVREVRKRLGKCGTGH